MLSCNIERQITTFTNTNPRAKYNTEFQLVGSSKFITVKLRFLVSVASSKMLPNIRQTRITTIFFRMHDWIVGIIQNLRTKSDNPSDFLSFTLFYSVQCCFNKQSLLSYFCRNDCQLTVNIAFIPEIPAVLPVVT